MLTKATTDDVIDVKNLFEEMVGEELGLDEVEHRVEHTENTADQDLFLYYNHDEPVGLLGLKVREDEQQDARWLGEVTVLVVKEDQRGKGIGKELIDQAENIAWEKSCDGVTLVSGFGKQAKAYQLYRNKGFEDQGSRLIKYF